MKIEKRIFIIPRLSLRHIAIIKSGSGKNNPPTGGKLDGKQKVKICKKYMKFTLTNARSLGTNIN